MTMVRCDMQHGTPIYPLLRLHFCATPIEVYRSVCLDSMPHIQPRSFAQQIRREKNGLRDRAKLPESGESQSRRLNFVVKMRFTDPPFYVFCRFLTQKLVRQKLDSRILFAVISSNPVSKANEDHPIECTQQIQYPLKFDFLETQDKFKVILALPSLSASNRAFQHCSSRDLKIVVSQEESKIAVLIGGDLQPACSWTRQG